MFSAPAPKNTLRSGSGTVTISGLNFGAYIVETEDGSKQIFNMNGKGDPGYKVTSKLVSECALCLIENEGTLPGGNEYGGVLTSASGLGGPLIARLKNAGISFQGPL